MAAVITNLRCILAEPTLKEKRKRELKYKRAGILSAVTYRMVAYVEAILKWHEDQSMLEKHSDGPLEYLFPQL